MTPSTTTAAERTLAFYQGNAQAYADGSGGSSMLRHGQRLAARLPRGGRVLDLGCGSGRDLLMLRGLGLEPTGLDYADRLARVAVARSEEPVVLGDMRRLPFAAASFDGIWASASLLHLDRVEAAVALAEARRVLRLGGVLFASMKAGDGTREEEGRTFTLYQPGAWVGLLRAAGFSDATVEVETEVRPVTRRDGSRSARQVRWLVSFGRLG